MKEKFTTDNTARKFKKLSYLGIGLIVMAILLLFTENYSDIGIFQLIGKVVDKIFILLIGTIVYVFFTKKSKLLIENYLEIDEYTLIIKANKKSISFDLENKPKSIKINLKTINIVSSDNMEFEINIDDYSTDFKVRKKIKERIGRLKAKYYA